MLPEPNLDGVIKETRRLLHEHYRKHGMDKPAIVTVGIKAYSTPQAAEMAKRAVPPGVNFTEKPRVSGELRSRYLEHLRDLCGQEYISVAEAGARIDAMMSANTEDELKFLIHDLPALAEEKQEPAPPPGKRQAAGMAYTAGAAILGLGAVIVPVSTPSGWITFGVLLVMAILFGCIAAVKFTEW